jgi:toxin-antitoxin system PIN domain toxin
VTLLDVNVFLALFWPQHQMHSRVTSWISSEAPNGWATCTVTQLGFIRVTCSPAIIPRVSPADATRILNLNLAHPHHHFWPDQSPVSESLNALAVRLRGHGQITDAYLLALALRNNGRFATLDRGAADLAQTPRERAAVQLIEL